MEPAKENMDVTLQIHAKQKGQDGSDQIEALLEGVRGSGDAKLGVISKASLVCCVSKAATA